MSTGQELTDSAMNEALLDVVSTEEAARLLQTSVRSVQLWAGNGLLKAWRTPGGHRRITRGSIQAILDERTRAVQPEDAVVVPVPASGDDLAVVDALVARGYAGSRAAVYQRALREADFGED